MNALMQDLLLNDRDVETATVPVPALDVHVVEDGDVMVAEHVRSGAWVCFCIDSRHRDLDRRPHVGHLPDGAHPVTVHLYAVIAEDRS
ncbi:MULTISPECIES: hypothetical protein [Promicromonospora]|uniref:Uncharacterized protein n=2 Tax=Promicromonospora TaxID=43676 RepID=A0ABW4UZY4_9MICO